MLDHAGAGGGGQAYHPKLVIRWKSGQNLWKFGQNVAKSLYVHWFYKNGTQNQSVDRFLESCFYLFLFGQVRGNLGKNPSHPQKFTCSYTHALTNIPPPTCPKSNQLDHQLRHPVLWFRHHRKLTIRTKTSVKTTWTLFSNWYLQNKSFRARVIQPRTGFVLMIWQLVEEAFCH